MHISYAYMNRNKNSTRGREVIIIPALLGSLSTLIVTINLIAAGRPASIGQGLIANRTGLMTVGEKLREKICAA